MTGSPIDSVSGPLLLILTPFALLLGVVYAVYLAGFHTELFSPSRWLRGLLAAAAAAAVCVALYGVSYRTNDHQAQQLPILERLADPQAYPDDAYVDTAKQFPSIGADWLASRLQTPRPDRVLLALHLLGLALAAGAFLFLSAALFGDVPGALIGLGLFSLSYPLHIASPLALEVVLRDHFDLTTAGFPLMIFGLALWFLNLPYIASAAAGLLFYVNPLLSVQLFAALFLCEAARWLLGRGRVYGLAPLGVVIPGLVVAAPAAYKILLRPGSFKGGAAVAAALREWYPINYFASSWSAVHWLYAAALLGLCAWCAWQARRFEEYDQRVPAFLAGLLALWALAFVFSDVHPLRAALAAQFFRTDVLWVVFALACAGCAIRSFWADGRPALWAQGGLLLLAFIGPPRPLVLLLVLAICLGWERYKRREFDARGLVLKAGLFAASGLLILVGAAGLWLRAAWAPGPDVSFGLLLTCVVFLSGLVKDFRFPKPARWAGAAVLLVLAGAPSYRVIRYRVAAKTFETVSDQDREVQSLADWVNQSSDSADRFLVPPMERFRVLLRRPVVFEWLDGAAINWDPGFEGLWTMKAKEFHIDPAAMKAFWRARDAQIASFRGPAAWDNPGADAFKSMSEKDFAALASKYSVNDLVTYSDMPRFNTYFKAMGSTRDFVVYQYLYNYQ